MSESLSHPLEPERALRAPERLLLALIGPDHAPLSAFHRLLAMPLPPGLQRSSLDAPIPWIASSLLPHQADHALGRLLSSLLDQLEGLLTDIPALGMLVALGVDDGLRGAFGVAMEEAHSYLHQLEPAELRLCPSAQEVWSAQELRVAPLQNTRGHALECARWISAREALRWIDLPSTDRGSLRALASGCVDELLSLELRIRVISAHRDACVPASLPPAMPHFPVVYQGDQLELSFGDALPDSASLRFCDADFPFTLRGRATSIELACQKSTPVRVVLDGGCGVQRPIVLLRWTGEGSPPSSAPSWPGDEAIVPALHRLRDAGGHAALLLILGPELDRRGAPAHLPPPLHDASDRLEAGDSLGTLAALEALPRTSAQWPSGAESDADLEPRQHSEAYEACGRLLLEGVARRRLAQHPQAQQALEAAFALAGALHLPGLQARAERELGRCLLDAGDSGHAEVLLRSAIARWLALNAPLEVARCWLHLAWLYMRTDRFEAAAETYERMVRPAREAHHLRLLANAQQGLAQALHDLGRATDARAALQEALQAFVELEDLPAMMRTQGDLGLLQLSYGRPEDALPPLLEQHRLATQLAQLEWQGIAALNLGRCYHQLERLSLAERFLKEALDTLPAHAWDNRAVASLALAEVYVALSQESLALACLHPPDQREKLVRVELIWRRARLKARLLKRSGQIRDALEVLELGLQHLEAWQQGLSAPAQKFALEAANKLRSEHLTQLYQAGPPLPHLLTALERHRTRTRIPSETWLDDLRHAMPSHMIIFGFQCMGERVLSYSIQHGALRRFDSTALSPKELEQHLSAFQEGLSALQSLSSRAAYDDGYADEPSEFQAQLRMQTALEELSAALLGPLEAMLASLVPGQPIGLISGGLLHPVPWQLLRLPPGCPGAGEPLLETFSPQLIPSLLQLQHWLEHPVRSNPTLSPHPFVILADSMGDLPIAREEGMWLAQHLPGARLLCGPEATWHEFQRLAPDARLLHLAIHGEGGDAGRHTHLRFADRPVTAAELANLHLSDALVLLSACSAGSGELTLAGEGLTLLPHALLAAGARVVVASHWPIDEERSLELMWLLYSSLWQGLDVATALARAQSIIMGQHMRTNDNKNIVNSALGFQVWGDPGFAVRFMKA